MLIEQGGADIVRTRKTLLVLAASLSLLAAACGDDDDDSSGAATTAASGATTTAAAGATTTAASDTTAAPDTTAAGAATTLPSRGDADLVLWLDETRATALKPIVDKFAEEQGVTTQIVEVAGDQLRAAVAQTAPQGTGPDIFAGAHDWTGELAESGILAPINLGASAENYNPAAISGFTFGGKLYGLPYAVENVALFRNTTLVPTAPASFEELEQKALELKAAGTVDVPLAVQEDPADPYHNYPMFAATGGYVFGVNPDNTYNPQDLGLTSPGGIAAGENFSKWAKDGLIVSDVSFEIMIQSFASGKAPFAITGPWAVSDIDTKGGDALKYVVEPIPPVDGDPAKPFIGVQGFYQSAFAKNAALAEEFLLNYVNTPETAMALFEAQPRVPALTEVADQVVDDPIVAGFQKAGEASASAAGGGSLPNIKEMAAVWDAWTNAYVQIFGGADPTTALTTAQTTIEQQIGD
jgi:arabinogalactan oligomer/maltooligosaccharide transport system substrate-binding protein